MNPVAEQAAYGIVFLPFVIPAVKVLGAGLVAGGAFGLFKGAQSVTRNLFTLGAIGAAAFFAFKQAPTKKGGKK